MTSSEQLERETEAARARLAETLEELRSRVTPGQLVDQLFDYARDSGAGAFARNLGRDVVNNPLPVGLMSIGLTWLMFSNGRRSRRGATDGRQTAAGGAGDRWDVANSMAERAKTGLSDRAGQARAAGSRLSDAAGSLGASARDSAAAAADRASGAASRLGEAASAATSRWTDSAASVGSSVKEGAASAYDGAARVADGAASWGRGAVRRGGDLVEFCREQPLLLAGLGMAIGAALGAALSGTRAERELMGEASDEVKKWTQEQYDGAKEAVQERVEEVKSGVQQGLREALDQVDRVAERRADTTARPDARGDDATLVPSSETAEDEVARANPYEIKRKPQTEKT